MTRILGRQSFGRPADLGNVLSPTEAIDLLVDWVPNIKLRNHMFQVGYLLKAWARDHENLDENEQWKWQLAGWLHDADWEKWPDLHCSKIIEYLESKQIDPEIIHAIASHGPAYFGVEPQSKLDKLLYAFDELSGFVHAYSLMRPGAYKGMEVKGVLKRMKDKTFAAQVSRADITDAAARLGMPMDDLISFVIQHLPATPEVG
jgi:predicted hydrolase (HD superfamily)